MISIFHWESSILNILMIATLGFRKEKSVFVTVIDIDILVYET